MNKDSIKRMFIQLNLTADMENTVKTKTRYEWVDSVKFACCVLVVLGHTFMGIAEAGIIEKGQLYNLLTQAVYSFHVPLFFVCSGFLYQKSSRVHDLKGWGKNVADKLLNLGIPYITFTAITVIFKTVFSENVNNPAGDLFETIFISPVAPYWYLYALFFMFVFIPCLKSKKQATVLLTASVAARAVYLVLAYSFVSVPYPIKSTLGRMIWFALGIFLSFKIVDLKAVYSKITMSVFFAAAIALSVYYYRELNGDLIIQTIIGVLFVAAILVLSQNLRISYIEKLSFKFNEYFMPVYVMHTIFSAGIRILLLRLGVQSPIIHIICGLFAGFIIPIAVYEIAKKIPPLLFFIYPKKAILKMKRKKQ